MRPDRSEIAQIEDRGCLRWVLAVPLVILHLLAAGSCYYALSIQPQAVWDADARDGIVSMCFVTIAISALALLLTFLPSVRRVMGAWWLAPPLILTVISAVRWGTAS